MKRIAASETESAEDLKVLELETPPQSVITDNTSTVASKTSIVTNDDNDLSYLMREFIQCSFPYKSPGAIEEWTKEVHGLILTVRRGRSDFGLPYGTLARLGVIWLCTQIVENPTKDTYQLGRSLAGMLRTLGFNASTAKGSSRRKDYVVALRDLFACNISFTSRAGGSGVKCDIGKAWDLWGDSASPDQGNLFDSWIKPHADFREQVLKSHIPVPVWAIQNHVKSPMELDLLMMLSHRVHMLNNQARYSGSLFITTDALKTQFGNEYSRHRDFRRDFTRALDKIKTLTWPGLEYSVTEQGLTLKRCPQLVKSKSSDRDLLLKRHKKTMKSSRLENIQRVLATREFDTKTQEHAEMILRGLSYKKAVEAFWIWADAKKVELVDPTAAFIKFCSTHRLRNRS
jgi:hypothetical protein